MQQAYQALRVISEAQTVHIVLTTRPGTIMLTELRSASQALQTSSSDGIKAVILDFTAHTDQQNEDQAGLSEALELARLAVHAIPQPVLGVVRADLAETACILLAETDLTLVANEAELCLSSTSGEKISGAVAARVGHAAWSAPGLNLEQEMKRILDLLRSKSALALRNAKASTRLAPTASAGTGEQAAALRQVNQFYLENVMATHDAREGLEAFAAKRAPRWQNR